MFQRVTTALFGADLGADLGEIRPEEDHSPEEEEEEEEDWILVNYLTDSASSSAVDADEDDLVLLPPAPPSPLQRRPSLTSLSSTATEPDDLDAAATDSTETEDGEEEDDDGEFLRLDAGALEESWFVTPPACFTRSQPLPLVPSPLENLLIEHPSMSVYLLPAHNLSSAHAKNHRAHLQRAPASGGKQGTGVGKKEKRREARHRPEGIQRRPSVHSVLSAALSAQVDLLQPPRPSTHVTPPSRNALRRLNPQRPLKTTALQLHQPSHRQFNF